MAVLNGEKIFNDVRDGAKDISKLSRDEVLAAKTYIATRNRKTYSAEQPLGATEPGRKNLAAQNAALPPTKPKKKVVAEQPKTYTQLFEEYVPFGKEISSGIESAGKALMENPVTGPLLTAVGTPVSSLQDIVASKTTPKQIDDRSLGQILSAQKTGMGQAGAEYLRQKGVTEPTLSGLKNFNVPDIAKLIQSTLSGVSKREDAPLDITKNIYAQSAMASRGLSAQQAMQEAEAWAKRNPKLARTSAFSADVLLDPYAIPVGKAIGAISKVAKKASAPTPTPTPTKPKPSDVLQRRYPGLLTPKKTEPTQQIPTITSPEPEAPIVSRVPEPVAPAARVLPEPIQPTPSTVKPIPTSAIPQPAQPEVPAIKSIPTNATPKPITPMQPTPLTKAVLPKPVSGFVLPKELTKSNPRYNYGDKPFTLTFDSDLDKALYIVAKPAKSKAHDKFVDALVKYTGLSEPELKALGAQVSSRIKDQAKNSPAGNLRIADTGLFTKQAPAPTAQQPLPTATAIIEPPLTAPAPVFTKPLPTTPPISAGTVPAINVGKKLTATEDKKLNGYMRRITSGKVEDALDPDEASDAVSLAIRKGTIEPEYATKPVSEAIARIKTVLKPTEKPTKPTATKPTATKPTATKPTATKPTATKPEPTPKDSTIIVSKHIQPEVAQIAQQWKKMMGITENLLVITPSDLKNFAKNYPRYSLMLPGLQEANRKIGVRGTYIVPVAYIPDRIVDINRSVIFLKPQKSTTKYLELLSHEMGHMLMNSQYDKAPKNVRDAIDAEYDKWYTRNNIPKRKLADIERDLRSYQIGKEASSRLNLEHLTPKQQDYFLGKDEWFADQVARWATTTKKPLTVVEKFFARLAKVLEQFFQINKKYLPTQTMKDWLDGLEKSAKVASQSSKSFIDSGEFISQELKSLQSKNPKIESVLTATRPVEALKVKVANTVQEIVRRTTDVFKAYSKLSESQREKFFKGQTKIADANNVAIRDVDAITQPLKNAEEFDAFRRIVILRDLYQTGIKRPTPERKAQIDKQIAALENELNELASSTSIWKDVFSERIKRKIYTLNAELNPKLPKDLTVKEVVAELKRMENEHLSNPNIVKALNNYKERMKKVFDELVRRGKISADRERTDYYPHDVFNSAYALDFADPTGMGREFKSPYRFYTQQRVGSKEVFDTNFEEVITNTLTKVYMDNAIDDLAEAVIPEVDILRAIKPTDIKNRNQSKNIRRAQTIDKMRVVGGREQAIQRSAMVDLSDKIVDIDGSRYRFYMYGDKIHLIPENLYNELKNFREPQGSFFLAPFQKATAVFKGAAIAVSGAAHQTMNLLSGLSTMAVIDPKALLNARRAIKIMLVSNDPKLKEGVAKLVLGSENNLDGVKASDIDENIRAFAIDNGIIEPLQRSSNTHRFSPTWRKIASWMNALRFTRNVSQVNDEFLRMMKLITDYERALTGKPPVTKGIINTEGLDIEQKVTRTAHEFFINPKRQSKAMRGFVSQLMFPFINWAANSSIQTARYIKNNPKKSAAAFLAFPALLETWNNTEERAKIEEMLPEDKRKIPHYITDSVDENGKPVILYFNFLPGLSLFDLTNLDYIPQNVSDVLLGRKTGAEAGWETALNVAASPKDLIENFANPIFKVPFELGFNRSAYTGREIIPSSQKGTTQGIATGLEYALKSTVPPARAYSTAQSKIESAEPNEKASIGQALGETLTGISNPLRQIYKAEDRKKLEQGAAYRKIEKGTISANRQKQDILKPAIVDLLATGDVDVYLKAVQETNLRGAQIKAYRNSNLEELLSEALQKTKDKNRKEQLLQRLEAVRRSEEQELQRRAKRANE